MNDRTWSFRIVTRVVTSTSWIMSVGRSPVTGTTCSPASSGFSNAGFPGMPFKRTGANTTGASGYEPARTSTVSGRVLSAACTVENASGTMTLDARAALGSSAAARSTAERASLGEWSDDTWAPESDIRGAGSIQSFPEPTWELYGVAPGQSPLEREVDREVGRGLGRRERAEIVAPPHPVPAQLGVDAAAQVEREAAVRDAIHVLLPARPRAVGEERAVERRDLPRRRHHEDQVPEQREAQLGVRVRHLQAVDHLALVDVQPARTTHERTLGVVAEAPRHLPAQREHDVADRLAVVAQLREQRAVVREPARHVAREAGREVQPRAARGAVPPPARVVVHEAHEVGDQVHGGRRAAAQQVVRRVLHLHRRLDARERVEGVAHEPEHADALLAPHEVEVGVVEPRQPEHADAVVEPSRL